MNKDKLFRDWFASRVEIPKAKAGIVFTSALPLPQKDVCNE